jgi:hypothetical protein
MIAYQSGTRRLREYLLKEGWEQRGLKASTRINRNPFIKSVWEDTENSLPIWC